MGKIAIAAYRTLARLSGACGLALGIVMLMPFPFPYPMDSQQLEIAELGGYVASNNLSSQVMEVNLASYRSISQYTPDLRYEFGLNSCGLIATTQWMLDINAETVKSGKNMAALAKLMETVRLGAIDSAGNQTFHSAYGIQPSDLSRAVQAAGMKATAHDQWNLSALYQALSSGQIVVVDMRIQTKTEIPSIQGNTYAHFARVLGMDIEKNAIYLENTLGQQDGLAYWTLDLETFLETWQYPETLATDKPSRYNASIQEEGITQWALVIEPNSELLPNR